MECSQHRLRASRSRRHSDTVRKPLPNFRSHAARRGKTRSRAPTNLASRFVSTQLFAAAAAFLRFVWRNDGANVRGRSFFDRIQRTCYRPLPPGPRSRTYENWPALGWTCERRQRARIDRRRSLKRSEVVAAAHLGAADEDKRIMAAVARLIVKPRGRFGADGQRGQLAVSEPDRGPANFYERRADADTSGVKKTVVELGLSYAK